MDAMNRRDNRNGDISEREVREVLQRTADERDSPDETKEQATYRASVAQTKVPIYGNLRVKQKEDDALRFFSTNVNGLSFWQRRNYKVERLKDVLQRYSIDSMGFQEVCINWRSFKPSQTLASLLRSGADPIRSVASHNTREIKNVGHTQRGGTATLVTNQLAAYVIKNGTDPTGLGRWSWYLLEGEPGVRTYVITAYALCGNDSCGESTVFQQHERLIQEQGLKTNPKAMFLKDGSGGHRRTESS
ncbi:hypothetical protein ACHAXR_007367 [Thalassiosira sp. AJA248-18]